MKKEIYSVSYIISLEVLHDELARLQLRTRASFCGHYLPELSMQNASHKVCKQGQNRKNATAMETT